jgi:hypothetical protein
MQETQLIDLALTLAQSNLKFASSSL